jgi:hypothetical protein
VAIGELTLHITRQSIAKLDGCVARSLQDLYQTIVDLNDEGQDLSGVADIKFGGCSVPRVSFDKDNRSDGNQT